jgi:hypothetical protein
MLTTMQIILHETDFTADLVLDSCTVKPHFTKLLDIIKLG